MPDDSPNEKPRPADADAEEAERDARPHPFGIPALVIIVLLIVGGWFLITKLNDDTNMQDCIQSGRRNCAPIDTTGK